MNKQTKAIVSAALLLGTATLAAPAAYAQSAKATTTTRKRTVSKKKVAKKPTQTAAERAILEKLESMQAQIDGLKAQVADKDAKLATVQSTLDQSQASVAAAQAQSQQVLQSVQSNTESIATLQANAEDQKLANAQIADTIVTSQRELTAKIESPTTIHYKGVTITPVAFFALENVFRTRSLASDVNTPFNATPFEGAGQAHVSELNFSGRQSRIGGLFEGNAGKFKLSGYIEADFLSAGVTSNSNQSNSYTLRQRQFWGQIASASGLAVTGGQMWSLVTETKKSTNARTENLPMTIDAQYQVGFSWARQPGLRIQQQFGIATLAMSLENAQIIYAATNANPNFFIGNAGTGGGLYNATANYSNNVAPDVILKTTLDPKLGHFELGGIARFFRDRYYPNYYTATGAAAAVPTATNGAVNDVETGGGFFANMRVPLTKYIDFGAHALGGKGVGRYGTSTLPDVTVHPFGGLAPIKSGQGLFSVELHPNKMVDLFAYAGGEYAQRTTFISSIPGQVGKVVGYAPITSSNAGCSTETLPTSTGNGLAGGAPYNPGSPASCLGATRFIGELTFGGTYRVINTPRLGRLQYQLQYSYLERNAWGGLSATPGVGFSPKATNNMIFTGMRYYIP